MHPFSSLTIGIFVAGYITARWDLVTRLYELSIFAYERGVVTRAAKGFARERLSSILALQQREYLLVNNFGEEDPSERLQYDNMPKKNELLRIFWPSNLSRTTTPGVIVGWKNSPSDLFVITILEDVEARNVEYALKDTLFRNSRYPVSRIFQICNKTSMHVLGDVNYPDPPAAFNPAHIHAYTFPQTKRPLIYCPQNVQLSIQVILFDPPDPISMQYMSLQPISLALGNLPANIGRSTTSFDEIEAEEEVEKMRKAQLVEKLKFHTVLRHSKILK